MKIALLGSGAIMYYVAEAILREGHDIEVVATNSGADVSEWMLDKLRISPKVISDHSELGSIECEAVVMFNYAPLISERLLKEKRFINIHYALLPRFRGFHGFIWSMINDEQKMGYTVHLVDGGIDSGPIYFQHVVNVEDSMDINTIRSLLDKHLIENIGCYITKIQEGYKPVKQNEDEAIYVTRRKPEDGLINWNWPARLIFNHIRALTPPATPGAYSFYKNEKIILKRAKWSSSEKYFTTPGKVVCIGKDGTITIKCGDSVIHISEIEVAGKSRIPGEYFTKVGAIFSNCQEEVEP